MSHIDFSRKINYRRCYRSPEAVRDPHEILRIFESDRGRIINSAAIRRLQQKTQVFPLERNAAVRSRLTHSLEVQQVGRYIAKEILTRLSEMGMIARYGLSDLGGPFESIVEMACLMHDIGNPPFGHFGEAAINDWFRQQLPTLVPIAPAAMTPAQASLWQKIDCDLSHFEGNAQAIRLVHTLLGLNLTWAQVGCILKYTRPAWVPGPLADSHRYLMKKPGYYLAEADYVARLRDALQLAEYNRFPLTWIMEAADDISYCVADLEDAVEKRIFSVPQLYTHLCQQWGTSLPGDLFDNVVTNALEKARNSRSAGINDDQFFMYLRVNTVAQLVPHAAGRFIDNIAAVYEGHFDQALLEDGSSASQLLAIFKNVAARHVFNHPEVEQLELQGYRVMSGLLDIYRCLLALDQPTFSRLVREDSLRSHPIETRLYHKLSSSFRTAYMDAVAQYARDDEHFVLWEFYYRCRLIQDYISGMTDLFAWDEYRRLMAVE
ncbi:dGTPase [Pantoea sp. 1.19]|uniref:dGTPase n=1 Tax=Pantoea sp. 1.19 TaxID=1925589 RepID=UPI0009490526|nr:dGTPase [Pantoea sp. 1.19]